MSGLPTLRILCLTAMAPALTEAERFQNLLRKESSALKGEQALLALERSHLAKPKSPLSFVNIKNLGSHFDTSKSKLLELGSSHLPVNDIYYKKISDSYELAELKHPQLKTVNKFYAIAEDYKTSSTEEKRVIQFENLKIMNQQQFAVTKKDSVSSVVKAVSDNKQSNDQSVNNSDMVNGDTENEQKLSKVMCNEKGDAQLKRNITDLPFSSKSESKITDKMGVCMTQEKLTLSEDPILEDTDVHKSVEEMRKECTKRQTCLEKKIVTLLRRLKRVKGKVVESHTKEQLRQFVNYQHRNLQMVAKIIKKETPGPEELKEHFLSNEDVKNMSTAQLVKLVKTYQSDKHASSVDTYLSQDSATCTNSAVFMDSAIRSQSLNTSERLDRSLNAVKAELDSDATASSSGGESGDEEGIPAPDLSSDVLLPPLSKRAEWKWAVDRASVVSRWTWLQAQVSDLEYRIRQQSQVYRQLRNSKGGVVLGDPPAAIDIFRRLQGLPVKGTHHEDGKNPPPATESALGNEISPCAVSAVMSNIDKQALRLTKSLGNCLSPANSLGSPVCSSRISPSSAANFTADSPSSCTTDADTTRENSPIVPAELRLQEKFSDFLHNAPFVHSDTSCQSARCRPLRSYRKRKILKTVGLYKTSLKAARLSDVGCRCYPPSGTCPMCGGRYNNKQGIDTDTMHFNERVSILDPSFHPVLSFPQDVHLPIHCEGLLKSGLWQKKPSSRKSRLSEYRRQQKAIPLITEPVRKKETVKQLAGKNNTASSVILFSSKIKNKYESKVKGKKKKAVARAPAPKRVPLKQRVKKNQRKAARIAKDTILNDDEEDDLEEMFLEQDVPSASGVGRDNLSASGNLKDIRDSHSASQRRRKFDDSYDINNIVIPLSMAANTRIEQPQYKEIVTPKWRELTDECGIANNPLSKFEKPNGVFRHLSKIEIPDPGEEDLSEESFVARHAKPEMEERKRFRNFVHYPPVRRNRGRSEVHLETPECSNKSVCDGLDTISESEQSRPSTPMLNKSFPSAQSTPDETQDSTHAAPRRRISFSRRQTCEEVHNHLSGGIEPWPTRDFPLSEEETRLLYEDAPLSCEPLHQRVPRAVAEPSGKVYVGGGDGGDEPSAAPSPHPSNESVSSVGDDSNDPEWIGAGGDSVTAALKKIRHRRIIDDDPNDPEWHGTEHRKKKNKR